MNSAFIILPIIYLIIIAVSISILILLVYVLILSIKALKIYIEKNSRE